MFLYHSLFFSFLPYILFYLLYLCYTSRRRALPSALLDLTFEGERPVLGLREKKSIDQI